MRFSSFFASTFASLAFVAALGTAGCSAADAPPQDEPTQQSQQAYTAMDNCKGEGNDVFTCSNLDPERIWNPGAYQLIRNLSAWRDEKLEVTNQSDVTIAVVSAQGLNQQSTAVLLTRGQSTVLSRLDAIAPLYTTLLYAGDAPKGSITVRVRVIEPSP